MNMTEPLGQICSLINEIPHTFISAVWTFVAHSFSLYWYVIVPFLIMWVVFEVITRGGHSYNSDNGFTPIFNSFVGELVFYITAALIDLILEFFFGKGVNCSFLWVRTFYLVPFISTGLMLHGIGFWPYLKIPILNIKVDLFHRGSVWKRWHFVISFMCHFCHFLWSHEKGRLDIVKMF